MPWQGEATTPTSVLRKSLFTVIVWIMQILSSGRYQFRVDQPQSIPIVMGILNVTPDSFSDGGHYQHLDQALNHAEKMIRDGVDIIDIGGESTRPGAAPLSLQEELDRVMPAIFALRDCGKALSIDTRKPEVMREAVIAGVDMVNDVGGFGLLAAREVVAQSKVGLCVMHMQNTPSDMQLQPHYDDVNREIIDFLRERVALLATHGVVRERICIDPGFGFGKTLAHNIEIFEQLGSYSSEIGAAVLVGVSRKSMIGALTGKPIEQRMAGSVAAALFAAKQGAHLIRVHDVAETVDALKVWQALRKL